ncbi:Uncharacterized protein GBIM_17164 [Gryllus bimaculatus]|nr:Uncharacterized protein GBIM_17164 [Gryllus bimaculatus]
MESPQELRRLLAERAAELERKERQIQRLERELDQQDATIRHLRNEIDKFRQVVRPLHQHLQACGVVGEEPLVPAPQPQQQLVLGRPKRQAISAEPVLNSDLHIRKVPKTAKRRRWSLFPPILILIGPRRRATIQGPASIRAPARSATRRHGPALPAWAEPRGLAGRSPAGMDISKGTARPGLKVSLSETQQPIKFRNPKLDNKTNTVDHYCYCSVNQAEVGRNMPTGKSIASGPQSYPFRLQVLCGVVRLNVERMRPIRKHNVSYARTGSFVADPPGPRACRLPARAYAQE